MPIALKMAHHIGLVDVPDTRKKHKKPAALIGGLVIFYIAGILATTDLIPETLNWTFYAGIFFLVYIGVMDDISEVPPWFKFFVHFFTACLAVLAGHAHIVHLGHLFSDNHIFYLGFLSVPFSVAAIVLLMNSMNLTDGLDGLAGGVSLVILFWLMLLNTTYPPYMMMILAGAIAGFWVFNMRWRKGKPASVFLGDAGSIPIGFTIGWYAIHIVNTSDIAPMTIAWILAVPIYDTCAQFTRRVKNGQNPFFADRGHFHHHFIDAGWSVRATTLTIMLITFLFGGIGFIANATTIPPFILTLLWISLLLGHIIVSLRVTRYQTLLKTMRKAWGVAKK